MRPSRDTWTRFRAGERDALAEVVTSYAPSVRNIAARYFKSVFDQEEAVQEVWLHLYHRRQALDLERLEAVDGWVATLARRRCLDLLRKMGRQPPHSRHDDTDDVAQRATPDPDDHAELGELRDAVAAFTARLDRAWADFFELAFVQGLTYPEIAVKLSISRLRCRYMKKVLAARARKNRRLLEALDRWTRHEDSRAP